MFYGLDEERGIHEGLCCLSELPGQAEERHSALSVNPLRHVTLTAEGGEVLGTPAFVLSNNKCHPAQG